MNDLVSEFDSMMSDIDPYRKDTPVVLKDVFIKLVAKGFSEADAVMLIHAIWNTASEEFGD